MQITAVSRSDVEVYTASGSLCDLETGEVTPKWEFSASNPYYRSFPEGGIDFDATKMIGVCTSYDLVTEVLDLNTMNPSFVIDNSKNYQASVRRQTTSGFTVWLMLVAAGACVILAAHVYYWLRFGSPYGKSR